MVDCVHRLSVRLLLGESISDILCGLPYPSITFPLSLPINAFQVTLEGGSNGLATAPAVVTGTFLRESGDPAGITIPLVNISDPSGPQVIQTEIPPDSEDSGSFSITLTDPGTYQLAPADGQGNTIGDSNAITVVSATADSQTTPTQTTAVVNPTSASETSVVVVQNTVEIITSASNRITPTTARTSESSGTTSSDEHISTSTTVHTSSDLVLTRTPGPSFSQITSTSTFTGASFTTTRFFTFISASGISTLTAPSVSLTTTITSSGISYPTSPATNPSSVRKTRTGRIIGGIFGAIGGIILLALLYYFARRKPAISHSLNTLKQTISHRLDAVKQTISNWLHRLYSRMKSVNIGVTRNVSNGRIGIVSQQNRWYRASGAASSILPFARMHSPTHSGIEVSEPMAMAYDGMAPMSVHASSVAAATYDVDLGHLGMADGNNNDHGIYEGPSLLPSFRRPSDSTTLVLASRNDPFNEEVDPRAEPSRMRSVDRLRVSGELPLHSSLTSSLIANVNVSRGSLDKKSTGRESLISAGSPPPSYSSHTPPTHRVVPASLLPPN
ncbi:uncharacterized protein C8R40DRAFT_1172937 [Lentinula edodes]|uniref:uncharacterized protein n=1 Tax=Lentinula edodes TaxID=5353 RepID=UPI001E8E559C|nr:uncharacterized protein C8R40DRAFT_1172937 [Lentinula edodes]KAH7873303.1 hypothetical protein C8R40DRAFT_1172937 [Lentinula edodes]